MQPIFPIFQSILRVKGRRTCVVPTKLAIDGRMDIVFRDVISVIPKSVDFVLYRFNISSFLLMVHRRNDPNILVFKCHNSFLKFITARLSLAHMIPSSAG